MQLVLFDCDGTLVNSAARIHETMRLTFVAFNHPEPTLAETKSIIGLSLEQAIAKLLGRHTVDDEASAMRSHFKSISAVAHADPKLREQLYPGISGLIASLAIRDDVVIGAVTGNSRLGLTNILMSHGFVDHFKVSRTADDCPSKPDPAMVFECCKEAGFHPTKTIVIGDAVFDMQMAKAAGAYAIGVSWGYGNHESLRLAGAGMIADTPNDILSNL